MSNLYLILSYACTVGFFVFAIRTFRNKMNFMKGVFSSAAASVFSFIFSVQSYNKMTGENYISDFINGQFGKITKLIASMDGDVVFSKYGVKVDDMLAELNKLHELYYIIFPALIILTSLLLSFLFYMFIKTIMRLFGKDVSNYTDFLMLRMPKSSFFIFVLSIIISFVSKGTAGNACKNIMTVLSVLFTVCGISLVLYWLKMRVKTPLLRALAYTGAIFIMAVFSNISFYVLSMISIADTFLDLRGKWSKGGLNDQTEEEQ